MKIEEEWEKREREKRKLSSKFDIRFLLWSRMEWIVKWLQNGQIRGKIKEREREKGVGVGGFAETRAGWNIEETRIVCTTGKEAISVTWTSPLVYIRGKGLYRAGFVSGFLLASTIIAIITMRFYTWARRNYSFRKRKQIDRRYRIGLFFRFSKFYRITRHLTSIIIYCAENDSLDIPNFVESFDI